MSDELNIEAIEARLNAATSGPWVLSDDMEPDRVGGHGCYPSGYPSDDRPFVVGIDAGGGRHMPTAADLRLIAHAPEDLRTLLAKVRRLTEERDRWREYCEGARESVATLTRERDTARAALGAVRAVVGSGS